MHKLFINCVNLSIINSLQKLSKIRESLEPKPGTSREEDQTDKLVS